MAWNLQPLIRVIFAFRLQRCNCFISRLVTMSQWDHLWKEKWKFSLHEMAEKNEKRNQPVRIQVYWTLNTSTKVHRKYPCQDGSFLWYLGQQWGWYLWQVEFWCFISIVVSMSFWDFLISFLKKRSRHTQANYINLPKFHPHKPRPGDPGLPLRQVQRQSALMHHQNPKHHKWYVDPGWSPPGNSCFSLNCVEKISRLTPQCLRYQLFGSS